MKFNKANTVGLTSPVQRAEMKLILAGKWPPLKPLPVFKYETEEYRASIDFDKVRGEWVCRKTSLPSNKIQELRGGLPEITMALPHAAEEVLTEDVSVEHPEQELEKDAKRRLHAIREWREKYENGARYSELQHYLSESQQDEICDILRLSLTARQLQVNPKNIAYVFDALSKTGGRLATLIDTAQRNKEPHEEAQAQPEAPAQRNAPALEAERHLPLEPILPTLDRRLRTRTTPASRAQVELADANDGVVLNISETGMAVAAAGLLVAGDLLPHVRLQLPNSSQSIEVSAQVVWITESAKAAGMRFVDLTADARNEISNWIAPEKPASEFRVLLPSPVESLITPTLDDFPTEPLGTVFRDQNQTPLPERIAHTVSQASQVVVPEILDASLLSRLENLQEGMHHHTPFAEFGPRLRTANIESSADRISSADHIKDSPSRSFVLELSGLQLVAFASVILLAVIVAVGLTVGRGPLEKHPQEAQKTIPDATSPTLPNRAAEPASRPSNPSMDSDNSSRANKIDDATPSEEKSKESTLDSKSLAKVPSTVPNPTPRRLTPPTVAAPNLSPSSAMLVRGPGDGSKPFRVVFQEKPIAASPSLAMTSQLSVFVSPDPGAAAVRKPNRLQGGQIVSFVWPRYPRPGDRYGSAETVKVRTTIGKLGQVLDVKPVSGSNSLLPAAMSAIRLWRYKPTLLDNRPVEVQQDVTIRFRQPQYLTHMHTQHPPHN